MKSKIRVAFACALFCLALGCQAKDAIEDAIDIINIDRKPINTSKTGVNAFVNDGRFGSINSQFREVQSTLRLGFVRVLMAWDDNVQPSPNSQPDFSFYDSIIANVPSGMDVLIVLTDIPNWMKDSSNWIDGDPRKTFVELWVRKVASRYQGNGAVSALQIWNEPNMAANSENGVLGLESPLNYVSMLSQAHRVVKSIAPSKRVVNAATTSINQNYPDSLIYNQQMKDAGAEGVVDVWAIHYYGKQFERVVTDGGVADFLNAVSKPIWVTESGAQGVNNQLPYVEEAWPFLSEKIPGIDRFYYYQFTEASAPETTYGLKNLSTAAPVSDLYVYLRDR